MDKLFTVFVSSTFADLKEERGKVEKALMCIDCVPIGMELFLASDEEQFSFIKKQIDRCDYYVLIIGERYGSVTQERISYTEREYDYAIDKRIPILAFIRKGRYGNALKLDLNERALKRLAKFKKKVSEGRLVYMWESSDDLISSVISSVQGAIKSYHRTGWVRGGDIPYQSIRNIRPDLLSSFQDFLAEQSNCNPITLDYSVDYIFDDHPNNSHLYQLFQRDSYSFFNKKNSFRLILSDDTEILNQCLTRSDELDFVLGNSDISDYTNEVLDSIRLEASIKKAGRTQAVTLKPRQLDENETSLLLSELGLTQVAVNKLRVLEYDFSMLGGYITVTLTLRLVMRISDQYYSWFASGLTYLKSIRFNYRGLAKKANDFNVQHFFSSQDLIFMHDTDQKIAVIDYNGWIIRGQGAMLVWRNLDF